MNVGVRYFAIVLFLVAQPWPSIANAKAKAGATCDPSGHWTLKVTHQTSGPKCGKTALSKTVEEKLIVAQKGKGYEVRNSGQSENERLKVEISSQGGCRLIYQILVNVVASGTPDYEQIEYELIEKDGVVSGLIVRNDVPEDEGAESGCSEVYLVTGTKKVLSVSDVTMDATKAPVEFASYYKQIIKEFCELPILARKKKDVVAVRALVGKAGEIKQLWIDGIDQQMDKNCRAAVAEGRVPAFKNPTGKDQTLEFAVRLQ